MRLAIRARARAGNPDAEVLSDPVVREDPYAHYERLRTAAPFTGGAFARVSVHHEVCTDVLRSDDFGQIGDSRTDGTPPLLRAALRALFERSPDLAPAGPGRRRRTIVLRGYESLPVLVPSAVRAG
jgi:hypothetical protein